MIIESQLKAQAADINVWTCAVVALFTLLVLIRLEQRYRGGDYRFVYHSIFSWWLAWLSWVVLWGLAIKYGDTPNVVIQTVLLLLSDLNTVFIILTYLGLTRARDFPPAQYLLVGLLLVISVGGVDAALLHFPTGNVGVMLQQRWSLALSMFAPVLIGWAFRLRYGSYWVLIAGVIYAFLQPPAYEALFNNSFSYEDGTAILTILSLMKVAFAFSVLVLVGRTPPSYESLVQSPNKNPHKEAEDSWWPLLPRLLAVAGTGTVVGLIFYLNLRATWSIIAILSLFVAGLGTWLKVVESLGKWLNTKTVETVDEVK